MTTLVTHKLISYSTLTRKNSHTDFDPGIKFLSNKFQNYSSVEKSTVMQRKHVKKVETSLFLVISKHVDEIHRCARSTAKKVTRQRKSLLWKPAIKKKVRLHVSFFLGHYSHYYMKTIILSFCFSLYIFRLICIDFLILFYFYYYLKKKISLY